MAKQAPVDERLTAVLFSGGGMKGSLQVGMAQHLLRDRRWPVKWVRGVSTGALQATMLAHGTATGLLQLEMLWMNVKKREDLFISPPWWKQALRFVGGSSLMSNEPLWRQLQTYVNVSTIRSSGVDLRVGVCNFNTKLFYEVGPNGVDDIQFLKFVLASTSIPGEFAGVRMAAANGYPAGWYFDGGVMSVIPTINGLLDAGAERIVMCLCNPRQQSPDNRDYGHTFPALKEALEISLEDNAVGDLDRMGAEIERVNTLVRFADKMSSTETAQFNGKRLVDFIVIAPTDPAPIGTLEVDPVKIRQCIRLGRELATKAVEEFYAQPR